MRRLFFPSLIVVAAFLIAPALTYSQGKDTGAIEGRVLDDGGSPLPSAQVKLSSPNLIGGVQIRTTDGSGKFRFVLLPPGMYVLEATLPGFTPAKADNIRLFVGQTLTIDLTLKIGKLSEEVTVKGTAPLVDVKDSQILATNVDRQTIETIGNTRTKASTELIDLAPGTVNESVMGAPSRVSNLWQVDGMNLTWLAYGADGNYPDITLLEEVQISGIGANAEYGNFMGAAFNLITKSGGNKLEGFAEVTYSPLGWVQKNFDINEPMFSLYSAPPRKLYFDTHAGLGGPIFKDKLWFYISGGTMQTDTEIQGFSQRASLRMPSFFLKLTFQPDANNRFHAYFHYEGFDYYNRRLSPTRPMEATYYDWGPDFTPINLSFFHTFSDKTFLEVKAGMWKLAYEQRPNSGLNVSQRLDFKTGMYSGNYGWWGKERDAHVTVNASLSHHADHFIKGSHDFKAGIEYLTGYEKFSGGYPGGFNYVDNVLGYDNKYHTYAYSYTYSTYAKATKFTGFVQDSWRISERITINPGVRYSTYRGTLPNVPNITFKPKNAVEPRIGVTWDLLGDHTTALKVHYGKYVDSIKTAYYQTADNSVGDWVMYDVLPDKTKIESYRSTYSNRTGIDPNIKMPSSDQFSLGLERTLTKDMAVGATFIYREFKNFIEKVNMTATWEKIPYSYQDENGAIQNIYVYQKTSGSSDDRYLVTNPVNGMSPSVIITPKNKYSGLTLFAEKRFSNKWMLHASYTYGVAKGNLANDWNGGTGALKDYLNPNLQINAYGHLPNDPTHLLQIYGTFVLPLDFNLSPRFVYATGTPWTEQVRVPVFGSPDVSIEPRGSHRTAEGIDLDFRLEKTFRFKEKMRVGLILDLFNLLNRGIETDVYPILGMSTFGKASSVNDGRYFRLALRFFF